MLAITTERNSSAWARCAVMSTTMRPIPITLSSTRTG